MLRILSLLQFEQSFPEFMKITQTAQADLHNLFNIDGVLASLSVFKCDFLEQHFILTFEDFEYSVSITMIFVRI